MKRLRGKGAVDQIGEREKEKKIIGLSKHDPGRPGKKSHPRLIRLISTRDCEPCEEDRG